MKRARIESFRRRLLALRSRLAEEIEHIDQSLAEGFAARGQLSHLPSHFADQDSGGVDTEITLDNTESAILREVRAALRRLEAGKFGQCVHCGRQIAAQRLDAMPYVKYCIDCERKREAAGSDWEEEEQF